MKKTRASQDVPPVKYRPGGWCDVAPAPDGFWLTWTQGALVSWQTFRTDGSVGPDSQETAPESLMFCRAAVHGGNVFSIHQGHDSGKAWLVGPSIVKDLGLTFGVQPVAIDGTYAYVVRSGQSYDRIHLDTGAIESFPHGVPGSSQGIRDVREGAIVWADNAQVLAMPFPVLHQWSAVGEVVVGQTDPPQIAGVFRAVPFTAIPGEAYEPHVAQNGASYAICARTPLGAAMVVVPPFPKFTDSPVHPPAPPPVQPPTPEPTPMPLPLPDKSQFARDFLGPRLALVGSQDETRAHTFAAVKAGCIELRKTEPRAGLLVKTSGDNVDGFAADIWLFDLGNDTAQVVDVVNNGEGAPDANGVRSAPSPGWSVKDIRQISQWVAPSDGPVDPDQPGPVTPGPAPQRPDTAAIVATLQGAIAALARIPPDRPEPPPPPPPPPPVVVDKEHPSYDAMQAMIEAARTAYGRRILPPATAAHFVYGFLLEGRTVEDIVEDARARGQG